MTVSYLYKSPHIGELVTAIIKKRACIMGNSEIKSGWRHKGIKFNGARNNNNIFNKTNTTIYNNKHNGTN